MYLIKVSNKMIKRNKCKIAELMLSISVIDRTIRSCFLEQVKPKIMKFHIEKQKIVVTLN